MGRVVRWRGGDDEGAVAVEYGFLLVFIVIAMAIGAITLGLALFGVFESTGEAVEPTVMPSAPSY